MEPKARHIVIGLFAVGMLTAAMVFALWLTKGLYQAHNQYLVHFKESVTGLSRGSAVLFSGIHVGEVLELSLDANDPRQVYARISVKRDVPIYEDVQASLQFMGVTGQAVITLKGGSPDKPLLLIADEFELFPDDDLPIITASPSPLSALLEDGQDILSNMIEISAGIKKLFSESNIDAFSNTLAHIDVLMGTIASEDKTIAQIITQSNDILESVSKTLASIEQLANSADALVNKEGKDLLERAVVAVNNVANSGQKIHQIIAGNEGNINQGLQGFKELTPAIVEFKRAFGTLQNILRGLEDNPAAYFIEGSSMKEFKR